MDRQKRILMAVVAGLLILTLYNIGASSGWSQGYMMGYLAGGGDGAAMVPYMARGHGFGLAPLAFGFGALIKIGFFFIMFMIFGKFLRFFRWRMAEGGMGHHWNAHNSRWHNHHGSAKDTQSKGSDVDRDTMI